MKVEEWNFEKWDEKEEKLEEGGESKRKSWYYEEIE